MKTSRKVTVQLPADLLKDAQEYTGEGITPTIRRGLEQLRHAAACEGLLKLRGKVRFSLDLKELRRDRR